MPTRRPTSTDVARQAGVSRTTVSIVLNEVPGTRISRGTRDRVLKAADDLGYPRPHGHRAATPSRTIAMVVPQTAQQLAAESVLGELLRGVAAAARAEGYRVLIEPITDEETDYDALLGDGQADGLIISDPRVDDPGLAAISPDRPVIVHGTAPGSRLPSVDVDTRGAAHEAMVHLVGLGHRRIAFIAHAPLGFASSAERYAGYEEALLEVGLSTAPELVEEADVDAASGWRAMRAILARTEVEAVFAGSDVVALGAIGALREAGREVPADVSVVGFDDITLSAYFDPPLTTVHLPAQAIGLAAGRALVDRLAGRPVPQRTVLPARLVERASTAFRPRVSVGGGAR